MATGSSGSSPTDMQRGIEVSAEIAERLRFETLLGDLAAGFINLEPEQVEQAIEDCLHHIVEALGVDRSTLAQLSRDDLVATEIIGGKP